MALKLMLTFIVLFALSFVSYSGGTKSGRNLGRALMAFSFSTVIFWIWS